MFADVHRFFICGSYNGHVVKEAVKSFRNGGTLYDISVYPCTCK